MAGTGRNFAIAAAMLLVTVGAAMVLPSAGWACGVAALLAEEKAAGELAVRMKDFKHRVALSKVRLHSLFEKIVAAGGTVEA